MSLDSPQQAAENADKGTASTQEIHDYLAANAGAVRDFVIDLYKIPSYPSQYNPHCRVDDIAASFAEDDPLHQAISNEGMAQYHILTEQWQHSPGAIAKASPSTSQPIEQAPAAPEESVSFICFPSLMQKGYRDEHRTDEYGNTHDVCVAPNGDVVGTN